MNPETLIHRYLLGEASEAEIRQLDQLLAQDAGLRRQLILEAGMDAGLREIALERISESSPAAIKVLPTAFRPQTWSWAAAAVAVLLLTLFIAPRLTRKATVATLLSSENAAWESALPTTPGSALLPGVLELKSGIATIRFHSGADVILEAPARLELKSPMRGKLFAGAAVLEVPEPAIGFVMETPAGYAIDHGTQFAVRVDGIAGRSSFEVIQGEISVHLPATGEEARLTGQGQAATISADSLVRFDATATEREPEPVSQLLRIGTRGREGSAICNDKRAKYVRPKFLSVKQTNKGKWNQRSFFAFDLTGVDLDAVGSAYLRLNLVPSGHGFASRLPLLNRFGVYGLTNHAKAAWKIESLWDESPGPDDGILLGTFDVPRSQQRGSFGIGNEQLLEFLNANPSSEVTFIIVRETTQIEGEGPGLTHAFAGDSHPEAVGPTLELSAPRHP